MQAAERTMSYGVVAGLVVSQANSALFDDLIHRQSSFDAVGWGNWFLFVLVPILAGGLLLYYGRTRATGDEDPERKPERGFLASLVGIAVASVVLRIAIPALLHQGDAISSRVPRTLADGFNLVGLATQFVPLAGQRSGYHLAAAIIGVSVVCIAIAFGALAFHFRIVPMLACGLVGAVWTVLGWYVPGGAGLRIIGSLWPMLVLGSVGLVLGLLESRR